MNDRDIRKYAELMKELGLTGLEITEGNRAVRLERSLPLPERIAVESGTDGVAQATQAGEDDASAAAAEGNLLTVKSPMVGVFYAAPAENAKPYVAVGDRVEKGTVLCILEAMKLMNEITAEESGVIAEICATNGQMVEFGTELFRIRRE